jgi:hypothetical protein
LLGLPKIVDRRQARRIAGPAGHKPMQCGDWFA